MKYCSAEAKRKARLLYAEGKKIKEICDTLGIHRTTLSRWLKEDTGISPYDPQVIRDNAFSLIAGRINFAKENDLLLQKAIRIISNEDIPAAQKKSAIEKIHELEIIKLSDISKIINDLTEKSENLNSEDINIKIEVI